jgi:hypothetical protein
MQFSPISRHFIPLRSKYSPQHPVFKHPHTSQKLILFVETAARNAIPTMSSLNLSKMWNRYVGVLISFWLFLFLIFLLAAKPKEFSLDGLKKLEQQSHKCVELKGNM